MPPAAERPPSTMNPVGVQPSVSTYPAAESARKPHFTKTCARTTKIAKRHPARSPSEPTKSVFTGRKQRSPVREVPSLQIEADDARLGRLEHREPDALSADSRELRSAERHHVQAVVGRIVDD